MSRLKLFIFFSSMAWVSVFRPKEGRKMVDAADLGALMSAPAPNRLRVREEPETANDWWVLFGILGMGGIIGGVALVWVAALTCRQI